MIALKQGLEEYSDSSDLNSDDENAKERLVKRRQELKQHKLKVIEKLNLHQAAAKFQASMQLPKKRARSSFNGKQTQKKSKAQPVRKSLRLQNIAAVEAISTKVIVDTADDQFKVPTAEHKLVARTFERSDDETEKEEEQRQHYENLMNSFSSKRVARSSLLQPDRSDLKSFLKRVNEITENGCNFRKVVEHRISAIDIHPGSERLLVAAGSTHGSVGIWDLEKEDAIGGTFEYFAHTGGVKTLRFVPTHPSKLFTCSYDGTLRATNLERRCLEEVLIDNDDWAPTSFALQPTSYNVLVSGLVNGELVMLDTRQPRKTRQQWTAHAKFVKSVCFHPVQHQYFATSSNDCKVKIFDERVTKRPLVTVEQHSKGIDRVTFSPITGNRMLTTCLDDRLRIFDTSQLKQDSVHMVTSIFHNNHTGRWLSNMEALWHPAREDVIISGSMNRPRQIELYNGQLELMHTFYDTEKLNSVCSLTCIHPSRNVFVGGNSSGRVFVFGT